MWGIANDAALIIHTKPYVFYMFKFHSLHSCLHHFGNVFSKDIKLEVHFATFL
jgi:hypothetical protein